MSRYYINRSIDVGRIFDNTANNSPKVVLKNLDFVSDHLDSTFDGLKSALQKHGTRVMQSIDHHTARYRER